MTLSLRGRVVIAVQTKSEMEETYKQLAIMGALLGEEKVGVRDVAVASMERSFSAWRWEAWTRPVGGWGKWRVRA
jgi:hypothetical protein